MTDELLPYYNRELAFLRDMGAEFAAANPKIAGRLRLDRDATEDPHVARMIEAVAYLNARTRHKLDDDFPEISEAMLSILYPHYLAPIPSMAIIQLTLDRAHADLIEGHQVARKTTVETESIEGQPCRFQTSYPVKLWPINVAQASYSGPPFSAPETRFTSQARAVVRIRLQSYSEKITFGQLPLESLRFYLAGQTLHVFEIYECILNNTLAIALRSSGDQEAMVLSRECVQPVGFELDQGLLPYTACSFLGYRLLSEYFSFPQKFLFFDLFGLSAENLAAIGNQLDVFFYLDRFLPELERAVSAETFQLGCTPMVNLFRQRAEPISVTHTEHEYRVIPDARRPRLYEVYTIDRVTATAPDGQNSEFQRFYSNQHAAGTTDQHRYWHASRRNTGYSAGEIDHGTEVFLSFVDLGFQPASPTDLLVDVETTCLNRDLPHLLPFGGGQPTLQLTVGGPLARITCLTRPTATLRPSLRHGALWSLISHLTLNHVSLVDSKDGALTLREILRLYNLSDSRETHDMIDGLRNVSCRRVAGRVVGQDFGGFCRGLEVTLHLDEEKFAGSGVYLFAMVLDQFLGLYCSINSFSKTVVTTNKRDGVLCRCPPRAGERVLV